MKNLYHTSWVLLAFLLICNVANGQKRPSDIAGLIEDLKSKDELVQIEAAFKLGQKGANAQSAIPFLIDMLGKDASGLKMYNENILEKMPAETFYIRTASNVGLFNAVSTVMAASISKIGVDDISPLRNKLEEGTETEVYFAAIAVAGLEDNSGIQEIVALLSDTTYNYRSDIVSALRYSSSLEALTVNIGLVYDHDVAVRRTAARNLAKWSEGEALDALLILLVDLDHDVRRNAASSLSHWQNNSDAIQALIDLMMDDEEKVVEQAGKSLQKITGKSYNEKDSKRWEVWWEVQNLPEEIKLAVESLEVSDTKEFIGAACNLGQYGNEAAPAVYFLIDKIGRDNREKYFSFELELAECFPERIKNISSDKSMIKLQQPLSHAASAALAKIGKPAIDALNQELLKKYDYTKRDVYFAAAALAQMGNDHSIEVLKRALDNEEVTHKLEIYEALSLGTTEPVLDLVINSLEHPDYKVRRYAAANLSYWKSEKALNTTVFCLNDSDLQVRLNATKGLGHWNNEKAIKALIGLLEDGNKYIRSTASESLAKISGQDFGESTGKWKKWLKKRKKH